MKSKEKGNLTELQCITALYEAGCDISLPFGNSQKYDIIIDYKGKLYKVQCKTAREFKEEGEITHFTIKTSWIGHNRSGYNRSKYTESEIDFFCTYSQGECFLLPIEECDCFEKTIRFMPPKNNQKKGITFAKDYTIQEMLGKEKL